MAFAKSTCFFFFYFMTNRNLFVFDSVWRGRQIEDTFAVELSKSNEKIGKMNGEISLLQVSTRLMAFSVVNLGVASGEKDFI